MKPLSGLLTAAVLFGFGTRIAAADGGASPAPKPKKPNVLFILTDDHRWDGLGCYGNASIRTPNLDRLAREGARLDRFYVASPLCCPSRAAFLTGLAPHQSGVLDNNRGVDLPKGTPTVATRLAQAGYVTGFVGKAHTLVPRKDPAKNRIVATPEDWGFREAPVWLPPGLSEHENPGLMVDGKPLKAEGMITEILADAAVSFIERHKDESWFLWLATNAPHTPYLDDPKHPYAMDAIKPPPGWPPTEKFPAGDEDWPGYYSTISHLDTQVGRILDRLDALKLADDTFVLMAGDNGWMYGSHGCPAKQMWYEESARVPALARWPGRVKPGSVVAAPVVSTDFLPSVLALAGLPAPDGLEGASFLPALTGGVPAREVAWSEVRRTKYGGGHWQMVVKGPWKYVAFTDRDETHLYNLADDPFEQKDLARDPARPETLKEMAGVLEDWRKKTPTPGTEPGAR